MTKSDFDLFVEHWDVKPIPGMALEILASSQEAPRPTRSEAWDELREIPN